MKLLRLSLLLLCLSALAYGQEKHTLQYAPPVNGKWQEKLSGQLADVQMQGQPAGITGSVTADSAAETLAVDEAAGTSTAQVTLSGLKASLNGNPSEPTDPAPIKMIIDRQGKAELPEAGEAVLLDFMSTGGVPLQFIAVLAHLVRLPAQPVAVDEEWGCEDIITAPGMGDVPINTRWKLVRVTEGVATLATTAAAVIPDFKIPNPMAPGTQMDVRAAKISITQMTQDYRLQDSRIVRSEGALQLDATLDLGGMQLPAVLVMKFTLEPAED